jgi:hypothetical protein
VQTILPAVHKLQAQYKLTPLSQWGKKSSATIAESRDVREPFDVKTDPLAAFKTMNKAMTENPPHERQAATVRNFASIGVSPGLDVEKIDAATTRGLARAEADGMKILHGAIATGLGEGQRMDLPTSGDGARGAAR